MHLARLQQEGFESRFSRTGFCLRFTVEGMSMLAWQTLGTWQLCLTLYSLWHPLQLAPTDGDHCGYFNSMGPHDEITSIQIGETQPIQPEHNPFGDRCSWGQVLKALKAAPGQVLTMIIAEVGLTRMRRPLHGQGPRGEVSAAVVTRGR